MVTSNYNVLSLKRFFFVFNSKVDRQATIIARGSNSCDNNAMTPRRLTSLYENFQRYRRTVQVLVDKLCIHTDQAEATYTKIVLWQHLYNDYVILKSSPV